MCIFDIMSNKLMKRNFSQPMTKIIDHNDRDNIYNDILWEDPHTILMRFSHYVAKMDTW